MAYEKITFQVAPSGVATVALNDPETRNALSDDLLTELIEALHRRPRGSARALRGAERSTHDSVFSSGGNLGGFAADVAAGAQAFRHRAVSRRSSSCWVSWASRPSAQPTGTSWPARWAWRWPAI